MKCSCAILGPALYRILYARYLRKGAKELISRAGTLCGKTVVDLCAGDCRVAKAAVKAKAKSVYAVDVDKNASLASENTGYIQITQDVESFLREEFEEPFDVVFCQQGINYWFCEESIADLQKKMTAGAVFVFNTFIHQPSKTITIRSYSYRNRKYTELSWLAKNVVHHVQCCEGFPPHTSSFQWISPAKFSSVLSEYFDVKAKSRLSTAIYVCNKRA